MARFNNGNDPELEQLRKEVKKLFVDDARMMFRNFEGREEEYNNAGERNFGVRLDSEKLLDAAMASHYYIRYLKNTDEEDTPWLKVKVKFGKYPPKIFMKSGKKVTPITEDTARLVDRADIVKANVIIAPYPYRMKTTGQLGVSAYLDSLYLTVAEDKYAAEFFGEDEEEEIPF